MTTQETVSTTSLWASKLDVNISETNATLGVYRKPSPVPSAITFTFGVLGNVIAIFVLFRNSDRHKWNVFYRFVTALAVTDLFGIITTSPIVFAIYDNNLKWVGEEALCHYMSFMLIFAGLATVLLAGAMALDRYMAILHPFKYNTVSKCKIVNFSVLGIWMLSAFISALPLFGLGENVKPDPPTWCFFNFFGNRTEDMFYSYFYAAVGLGTILLIGVLNVCVIIGLMKGKRSRVRRGSITNKKARARTDIYITIFLVAIFVVFGACWAPFLIRIIINQSGLYPKNRKADLLTLRLATLNQILDPWVYILFRREMLQRVTRFFRKRRNQSLFQRLASFTGSWRSNTSTTTDAPTNGTPIPQRRNVISYKTRKSHDSGYSQDSISSADEEMIRKDQDLLRNLNTQ